MLRRLKARLVPGRDFGIRSSRLAQALGAAALGVLAVVAPDRAAAAEATFYVISNKAEANTVIGFRRDGAEAYRKFGEFPTGGRGTGDLEIPALKKDPSHPLLNGDDPLISANALAATKDGAFVLAVNPGDGTVSLMAVKADKTLAAVNAAPATDKFPVSIAVHGEAVVVASVGPDNGSGSIGAYRIQAGRLEAVPGARRDLKARPSTIAFSTDGRHVIVNELVTGKIHAFAHDGETLSATPVSSIDSPRAKDRFQAIPVGFLVTRRGGRDVILMSEARFLTPDFKLRPGDGQVVQSPAYSWQTSSMSSYALSDDGALSLISGDVLTGAAVEGGEIANCWVALSKDGDTLWAVNAMSSSISAFSVAEDGALKLTDDQAFKVMPETLFFGDIALSRDGTEIYQLIGNTGQVMVLGLGPNGLMTPKQILDGLPTLGAYGLLPL